MANLIHNPSDRELAKVMLDTAITLTEMLRKVGVDPNVLTMLEGSMFAVCKRLHDKAGTDTVLDQKVLKAYGNLQTSFLGNPEPRAMPSALLDFTEEEIKEEYRRATSSIEVVSR